MRKQLPDSSGKNDLHLHSYYSDGTQSPAALMKRAAALGMETVALTDHDGLSGIPEFLAAAEEYNIRAIPGIEFSAGGPGDVYMHILGYNINWEDKALLELVAGIRQAREERNRGILTALNRLGYELTEEDLLTRPDQDFVGKPHFALALVKKGYAESTGEALGSENFLRHPTVRMVKRTKIPAEQVLPAIRNAGGASVLAHPMKITRLVKEYGRGRDEFYVGLEALLDQLMAWGLDGLECRHSAHTPAESTRLLEIAQRKGLIPTAGSDFHGPEFEPQIDLGVYW